jgi:bifunctional enzyme CysN/CysC
MQWVGRPQDGARLYTGRLESGTLRVGDEVVLLPTGTKTRIVTLDTLDPDREEAEAPMSVTVSLSDHVDVGRGDMLVGSSEQPTVARELGCTVC